jgi:hypothetical protein
MTARADLTLKRNATAKKKKITKKITKTKKNNAKMN